MLGPPCDPVLSEFVLHETMLMTNFSVFDGSIAVKRGTIQHQDGFVLGRFVVQFQCEPVYFMYFVSA